MEGLRIDMELRTYFEVQGVAAWAFDLSCVNTAGRYDPAARAQKIEEASSFEDFACPSRGPHNPKQAIRSDRHVVRTNQFTHARRIDPRDSGQVQHDGSLATTKKRPDSVPQLSIAGGAKRVLDVNGAAVVHVLTRISAGIRIELLSVFRGLHWSAFMSKTDETADFRHRRSVSSAWSTRTLNGGWTNHLEISFSGNPLTGVILIGRQRMGEGFAFGQMALDAASYLPARRASRVDPNVALRHL